MSYDEIHTSITAIIQNKIKRKHLENYIKHMLDAYNAFNLQLKKISYARKREMWDGVTDSRCLTFANFVK